MGCELDGNEITVVAYSGDEKCIYTYSYSLPIIRSLYGLYITHA
jgi:hypothetical protein